MKKSTIAQMSAMAIGILLNYSVSYGNGNVSGTRNIFEHGNNVPLFQDSTSKKVKPTKKAEIDRTKGDAGQGRGKGVDTIPTATDSGKQGNRSEMNKGTIDKTERNSDNRGEGAGKNNRAGNSKKVIDTTKQ